MNNPWLEAAPQQQATSNQKRLSFGPITVNNPWLEATNPQQQEASNQKRRSYIPFFF